MTCMKKLERLGRPAYRFCKIPETSCFQSQMHLADSVESTADSDLEGGELQTMLTSPLYAQKASEKPDALFSSEQGRNLIRSSVFRNANPSNLRGSLLESNKDHFLIWQDQSWRSKNFMSSPSKSASVNYSNDKRKCKDWHYKTHNTDFVDSRRDQVRLQEESSMKEVLRNTQSRNMHKMGEI